MIYKRKELSDVFAVKGLYEWDVPNQPNRHTKGAISSGGRIFKYEISGSTILFAEGENDLEDSGKEIFSDEWLLIHPIFDWNGYALQVVSDNEFKEGFSSMEGSKVKLINAQKKDIERKNYDIQIDFLRHEVNEQKVLWPTGITINGKKPDRHFLFNLGKHILECSRPEDYVGEKKVSPKIKKHVQTGYVYLMIDKNTGYHKIGFSKNPKHREKTLQSEKPTIELLHKFEGTMSKEKELHNRYHSKRIRGEWFDLNQKDIDYIKTL